MIELMLFPAHVAQFWSDLVPFVAGMGLALALYACVGVNEARRKRTNHASKFEGAALRRRVLVVPAGRKSLRPRSAHRSFEGGEAATRRGGARPDAPVA
jgi:hypothetical protein